MKTLRRLRGWSVPGFGLPLAGKMQSIFTWLAPIVLTLVDGFQLRISRISLGLAIGRPGRPKC